MGYREDGEIRDARRRRPDRHRSRSRSRSRRRRRTRSPRRPRYDDARRRERRRSPDPPRKVEEVKLVAPHDPKPPQPPLTTVVEVAVDNDDRSEELDEQTYAERVEQQLQNILGADQDANLEAELQRRRDRRRAMLEAMTTTTNNDVHETNGVVEETNVVIEETNVVIEETNVVIEETNVVETEPAVDEDVKSPPSDDDVDIFGDSPIAAVALTDRVAVSAAVDNKHLTDNWDDAEGYYSFRLGDALNEGRYEVFAFQGRGVFSTVLRVRDRQAGNRELVVKVIRQNDVMYKAGLKEVQLLKVLGASDPDNHRHCVRLYSHFEHRGHLCLVFEPLHLNLREVLKKYGGVGINIDGVRSYARQLFVALRLLNKCEIVHADIKPDNILVNAAKNVLKLCDFGSAGMITDCDITPYLVSRFYRAPEIILGLPYGPPIDVWSVGCVLFELYTGQILFKGADNNEMLLRMMELRGRFPPRLLRKATFAAQHFDEEFLFERRRADKVSGGELKTKMRIERPIRDLQTLLRQSAGRLTDAEMKSLSQLRDLLEKCLILDPAKRITPELARSHPFLQQ